MDNNTVTDREMALMLGLDLRAFRRMAQGDPALLSLAVLVPRKGLAPLRRWRAAGVLLCAFLRHKEQIRTPSAAELDQLSDDALDALKRAVDCAVKVFDEEWKRRMDKKIDDAIRAIYPELSDEQRRALVTLGPVRNVRLALPRAAATKRRKGKE